MSNTRTPCLPAIVLIFVALIAVSATIRLQQAIHEIHALRNFPASASTGRSWADVRGSLTCQAVDGCRGGTPPIASEKHSPP